jgi:hypothetical protein
MVRFPNTDVIDAPEWVIDRLVATLPLFTIPVVTHGPFSPVGLTIRLQRPRPSLDKFALEIESDFTPCFEEIAQRITSHAPHRS